MFGLDYKRKSEKGMTLLEALVSTAIIGIGFVAVFQMVNYSVQSIDVSGERTKINYLVGMVAEDLISEKNSTSPTADKKFMDYLVDNRFGDNVSWKMGSCSSGSSSTGSAGNTARNKFNKWDDQFSKKRIKCRGAGDTKFLKVYDICRSGCRYSNATVYDKWLLGKMQANMNDGKKKKYLYFRIK